MNIDENSVEGKAIKDRRDVLLQATDRSLGRERKVVLLKDSSGEVIGQVTTWPRNRLKEELQRKFAAGDPPSRFARLN